MLSRKLLNILIAIFSVFILTGRAAAVAPSTQSADLVAWTTMTVANLPGESSNGFDDPTSQEITDFQAAVSALLDEDWPGANDLAAVVGYQVVEFTDTGNGNEILYALVPNSTNDDGRGYFVVRPRSRVERHLVLQAPHPRNDQRSAVLASEVFRASGARAFFFAGTDRCANLSTASGCPGTSDACAGVTTYRISDMAHSVATFFEAFNELVSQEDGDTVSLQLHGFSADETGDPEFSISDGTTADTSSLFSLSNAFAAELEDRMEAEVGGTPARPGNSCNRSGDQNFKCGTNSIQGRFINGSTDLCNNDASAASTDQRFLHLEMSSDLRHPGGVYPQTLIVEAVNAVIPTQAEIGDRVWADLDQDGLQDAGEPGIDGVTVELYDGSNNLLDTRTTRAGSYLFSNLEEGDYRVKVVAPAGYSVATQDAGTDDAVDSDVATSDGRTAVISLGPGESRLHVDAGLIPPGVGEIGDRVWEDEDGDGLQDAGEPGIGGITLRLLTVGGAEVASTTTAGDGSYSFENVLPGSYKLRPEAPGWGATQQVAGFASLDSDVDPQTGETTTFNVTANSTDLTRDAGFVAECLDATLVPFNSVWRFLGTGDTWTTQWNQAAFNDAGWDTGFAPLGYGTSTVYTTVPQPTSPNVTMYFRLAFQVDDPTLFQGLTLDLLRDDGAVVYLNGTEVFRNNMPTGAVTNSTRASGSSSTTVTATISAANLATGTNVLAVEVHDRGNDSSPDGKLDLRLKATVCNPCRVRQVDLTQAAVADIREADPDDEHGARSTFWIDGDSGAVRNALLSWQLGAIPANAEILHAEILVQVNDGSSAYVPLYPLTRDWVEYEATWNRASDAEAWATAGVGTSDRGSEVMGLVVLPSTGASSIVLNPAGRERIEDWLAGTVDNQGLIATRPGQTNGLEMESNEGINPPVLRLIYATPSCQQ